MDAGTIRTRLQELAYLNASACIRYRVTPAGKAGKAGEVQEERLAYSGGLKEYVLMLNKDRTPLHKPIVLSREVWGPPGLLHLAVGGGVRLLTTLLMLPGYVWPELTCCLSWQGPVRMFAWR